MSSEGVAWLRSPPMTDARDRARTRAAYDRVAEDYAVLLADHLGSSPWDRAQLGAFAELVQTSGGGPVLDAGCGTGRLIGHLLDLGLDVHGIDLSPGMVDVARRAHPSVPVAVGDLTALDLPDASQAAALAWYSIIHLPAADRPAAFAELHRVLRPGGPLLVAFQVGDEVAHLTAAYGHDDLDYDAHRLDPDHIAAELAAAGLEERARTVRAAEDGEATPQAYLLVRRPD